MHGKIVKLMIKIIKDLLDIMHIYFAQLTSYNSPMK